MGFLIPSLAAAKFSLLDAYYENKPGDMKRHIIMEQKTLCSESKQIPFAWICAGEGRITIKQNMALKLIKKHGPTKSHNQPNEVLEHQQTVL